MDLDLNLAGFANWSLSILTSKFCSCSTPNRLKSKLKNNKKGRSYPRFKITVCFMTNTTLP